LIPAEKENQKTKKFLDEFMQRHKIKGYFTETASKYPEFFDEEAARVRAKEAKLKENPDLPDSEISDDLS